MNAVVTLLAVVLSAPPQTEAARLFEEGRVAMKARDLGRACPLFEKSFTLEPALGALLNVASCFEQQGRFASAWVRFNEAVSWAQRTKELKREAFALERAAALKARVSWLALSSTSAAQVKVDDIVVSLTPGLPSAVPVDVGLHLVSREQPGLVTWTTQVKIEAQGTTTALFVPELQATEPPPPAPPLVVETPAPAPAPAPVPAPVVVVAPAPEVKTSAAPAPSSAAPGWILVAVGTAIAVGGGIGLGWCFAMYDQVQGQRRTVGSPVVRLSQSDFETLQWLYPASWVTAGVGAATALSGIIVLAFRPSATSTASLVPVVSPGGVGALVSFQY